MATKQKFSKKFFGKKLEIKSKSVPKENNNNNNNTNNGLLATNIFMQEPSGIGGGTFASGMWITRSLNKIVGNASVTLNANNTFTLKKGTYIINCKAPAFNVGIHQARLFNVTDNKTAKYGNSALTSGNSSLSIINYFTDKLKVPTTFKLQHRCQNAQSGNGMGIASGFPSNDTNGHFEIYGEIEIFQLD